LRIFIRSSEALSAKIHFMTTRLYDQDHYLAEFDARVSEIDGLNVVLDQTAFYAQSGGQAGDRGTINGEEVVDTRIIVGEHVHVMSEEPRFSVGDDTHGVIDWDRRYRIMKIHSASHIMEHFLSASDQTSMKRRTGQTTGPMNVLTLRSSRRLRMRSTPSSLRVMRSPSRLMMMV